MFDTLWYVSTYHLRVAHAHLSWAGAPLIWTVIAVYSAVGFCLFIGYRKRQAAILLTIVLLLTALIQHTNFQNPGIGEVPSTDHLRLQFLQLLLLLSIAGSTLRVAGDFLFSRALTALWFIAIVWWPLPADLISVMIVAVHLLLSILFVTRRHHLYATSGMMCLILTHATHELYLQTPAYPWDWRLHLGVLYIALLAGLIYHLADDLK